MVVTILILVLNTIVKHVSNHNCSIVYQLMKYLIMWQTLTPPHQNTCTNSEVLTHRDNLSHNHHLLHPPPLLTLQYLDSIDEQVLFYLKYSIILVYYCIHLWCCDRPIMNLRHQPIIIPVSPELLVWYIYWRGGKF